ncbi:SGNH/GDSL hydrolase family protein [Acrocarpospora corrugata]|uniref:SGNH/GDSL hydrolase family protein n=1 Tax=Acrocarpospora corrugata TaxID=35763 RepID=UPI001479391D|nr:SGNH/GDSL hydrolase family protein [Acrocarpospora corrugata]
MTVLLSAIALVITPLATGTAAAATWTGTWAVSPQTGDRQFSNQTLRQIIRTSISGTAIRVQLSNAFGTQPVTFANVHVARRTSESSVDVSTDKVLTFGGQASITVPVGGLAASDEIAMNVAAESDLAVSVHLPSATGRATYHQMSSQSNYVAPGNVSGSANLTGVQEFGNYFFLANLDVVNASATGAVVTFGASIVDGVGSSFIANRRWPNRLATRLNASGRTIDVINQGISGNRLLADGAGQSAGNRFERDVLNQPGVRWVVFADNPINDLTSSNPPPTAHRPPPAS